VAAGSLLLVICLAVLPVEAGADTAKPWPAPSYYTVIVRPGDTLAKLAARYGVSVDAVAKLNGPKARSALAAGEVLQIPAGSPITRKAVLAEALDRNAPNYAPPPKTFHGTEPAEDRVAESDRGQPNTTSARFRWPVRGEVISSFGPAADGQRNDGINIAARLGAPIRAAASGTVTYAGDGLRAYGNLILISHSDGYVTAYAHAESIAVTQGDRVEKGQVIGAAGETGGVDEPQLHFEIRQGVRPVDPVRFLAALP
jgi:murein DD-endopeptidase MepM/ murein hydrolase activator NlpD